MSRVDDAVKRILRVKFTMGLFEYPLADYNMVKYLGRQEHRDLAREAVRKTLVLLKKGKSLKTPLLPRSKKASKILVARSHAYNLGYQYGGWSIEWQGLSGHNITAGTINFISMRCKKMVDLKTQAYTMRTQMRILLKMESKDDGKYNEICNKHKRLIETLPKGNGWRSQQLCNYNGFWLDPNIIKSNMLLNTYFKPRPTDIFLASFLKSGTTWLQALMFSTLNRHRYTFSDHYLLHHSPKSTFSSINNESYPMTDFSHFPEPRLFETHFPRTLLPSCMTKCKFVYICRDPKDVLVSKWHFMSKLRLKDLAPLSFDEAFELFCQGISEFGPIWEHVLSYWRASLESADMILFLKYEDIKTQPAMELRKLAAFIGRPFTVEEEEKGVVEEIVNLCSFENLSNLEVNKKGSETFGKMVEVQVESRDFFRKGIVGDWKNYLSDEMKERIDRITKEKLEGSGLILGS